MKSRRLQFNIATAARTILCGLMLALWGPGIADAQTNTRLCRNLEAKLSSGSKKAGAAKFRSAAQRQRRELDKTRKMARANSCFTPALFRFGRGNNGQCSSLMRTIEKMEANLRQLERKSGGGQLSKTQRRRILASLNANGCRDKSGRDLPRAIKVEKPQRTLPGGTNRIIITGPNGEIPATSGMLAGSYRTLCVRSCDGYYFPISFSATQNEFGRDSMICQSMCPGTDVELYYHSVPEQESEEMVSLDGRPYIEHPNALRYRSTSITRDPACSCRAAQNFKIVAGRTEADIEGEPGQDPEPVSPPLPVSRPDNSEDPETLANRDGGLTVDMMRKIAGSEPPKNDDPVDGVRVVGPAFLPDPAGAIDLKAPAQKNVR